MEWTYARRTRHAAAVSVSHHPTRGLVVGPVQGPAWVGYVVISRWLAFRGKLPRKIMGFLDDAHRLGLLRTVGSVYQFRHAELQDHLAKPGETAAPAQPK